MSLCPSCGHEVPERSFCPNCGAPLASTRRGEARRVVTTLFCDLVGFTALSERHDAEIVDGFLRRYYDVARRSVESYGGTVEKFIGDAVVAVFGVPVIHEDDPERAVRAGLRLVDEMDALPGIAGQGVEVRVGVNTGEALVRLDIDPASGRGFLIGDAVNVAARLQSAAPPMAVAVGEATHAATEKIFSFDACHPVALKGKSRPLAAWIANASLARTGSELRSFSSSFVGREEELAELEELLDAASESRSPRFVLLCGDPGIGKSRLLAEFARRLDDRPAMVTWRQGRCLPFGSGVTFWALSEIVKAQAGILESDGVARSEARLETVLPEGEACDRLRDRLRPLIGLEAEDASREDNFSAWREFLEGLARDGPTVLVVEDLHWADDPMLAFMDFLVRGSAAVPLLILATARPEVLELDGPGAGHVAAATRMVVGPLSGEETAELARARLGARSLPTDLHALILERSGGNPLFAEELVRLLEDRDLLDSRGGKVSLKPGVEVPMPDSIGSLIAARLDLLSADRKALLSDAAVVGRSFWAGAVAAVGPHDPAEVFEGLHELVAKELVRPERGSSMEGEAEFLFVHALVCDVAYEQLTRADRAAKHAALARWLEQRTAGRTEDLAEILAYHYGTALEMATAAGLDDLEDELSEPTTRYLEMAGGRAAPLDAAAAAAHFARAERVADEAARPKRRWLLSRRTRRTLKRRAPLLVAALAVISVSVVAGLAIRAFALSPRATGPVTMTAAQVATRYGSGIVTLTAKVPHVDHGHLNWVSTTKAGVVASNDGLIFTIGAPFKKKGLDWTAQDVSVGVYGSGGEYRILKARRLDEEDPYAIYQVFPEKVRLEAFPLGDPTTLRKGDPVSIVGRTASGLWSEGTHIAGVTHDTPPHADRVDTLGVSAGPLEEYRRPGWAVTDATGRLVGVTGEPDWGTAGTVYKGKGAAYASTVFTNAASWYRRQAVRWPSLWLGVQVETLDRSVARSLGMPGQQGALVRFVVPDSPASAVHLRGGNRLVEGRKVAQVGSDGVVRPKRVLELVGGDIITGVGALPVHSVDGLGEIIYNKVKRDHVITLHLIRAGKPRTVKVKLERNLRWGNDWL
jgi:class 3 adenylate cyclase/S1-C subfamily serine protease